MANHKWQAAFGVMALLNVAACGNNATSRGRDSNLPAAASMANRPAGGSSIAHVVWQIRDGRAPGSTLLMPDHAWYVLKANGLSLSDETDIVRANVFTVHAPRSVAFVPGTNKQEIVVLFNDSMPIRQGQWLNASSQVKFNLVERWNLATKKRNWSRFLPDFRPPAGVPDMGAQGRVTVSAKGVFVTRCNNLSQNDQCNRTMLRIQDGVIIGQSAFEAGYGLSGRELQMRADTNDGRFSLQSAKGIFADDRPNSWWVFDDEGRIRGSIYAECARFDDQNRLWVHAPRPGNVQVTQPLGIQVSEGKQGCVRPKAVFLQPAGAPPVSAINQDSAEIASVGDRIAWQHYHGRNTVQMLDTKAVGLPVRIESLETKSPDERFTLSRSATSFVGQRKNTFMVFDDRFANLRAFDSPLNAMVHAEGNLLLVHGLPLQGGGDPDNPQLRLGVIPMNNTAVAWKSIQGTTQYMPDSMSSEENGKQVIIFAGGRAGIQKYDVASGRRLAHFCVDKKSDGRLCQGEKTVGLIATKDKKTIWTYHSSDDKSPNGPEGAFLQMDLSTGKVLRRVRSPRIIFDYKNGYRMGWLEQDTRFWFTGTYYAEHIIAVVGLANASSPEPILTFFPGRGRAMSTVGHADGKFIAQYHSNGIIEFVDGDNEAMVVMADEADGFMAQARDGRFACTNKACEAFRCIVGSDVRPVTDAACAHLRVEGFSVQQEMTKLR